MNIYELNIKSVLDIPEWEKLQDQFAPSITKGIR